VLAVVFRKWPAWHVAETVWLVERAAARSTTVGDIPATMNEMKEEAAGGGVSKSGHVSVIEDCTSISPMQSPMLTPPCCNNPPSDNLAWSR
jgi:hypothetical protein